MESVSKPNRFLKMLDIYGKRITLRFDGEEYFNTYCGACATIILVLTLIIVFTLNAISIYNGKIASFTYNVSNSFSRKDALNESTKNFKDPYEIFAFAFEKSELYNSSFVDISPTIQHQNLTQVDTKMYDCTEDIYENLSQSMINEVPNDLTIKCLKINLEDVYDGSYGQFRLSRCVNSQGKKDCAPEEAIQKNLKNVKVWMFTLVDERDFSNYIQG